MNYALFLLVNAALFIRPAEIIPALEDWPVYQYLILGCLAVSVQRVVAQLHQETLTRNPVTVCLLGLWATVALSHLGNGSFGATVDMAWDFAKIVLYYLLLVGTLDTPTRFRRFLMWVVAFIALLTVIGVAQYHEVIEIPNLTTLEEATYDEATGEMVVTPRLRCTGLFNDPNDVCLIQTLGLLLCLYFFGVHGRLGWLWLAPAALFGYAFALTQSRGGVVGLAVGLLILSWFRWGWWRTLILATALAGAAAAVGGRQLDFDLANKEDTGQERVQMWTEGLTSFLGSPLFGIGAKNFADEHGLVAHNSFLHAYAELGFLGGAFFVSAFVFTLWRLVRVILADPTERRTAVYLLAVVASYAVGLLVLSRNYAVPTYMVLGLGSAWVQMRSREEGLMPFPGTAWVAGWVVIVGVAALLLLGVGVKVLVQLA